jgi:hypothetical protein
MIRSPGSEVDGSEKRRQEWAVNAIKEVRKYLEKNPEGESSRALARLVSALAQETEYSLGELYQMDLPAFELAIELLKDWRLDRYYAQRVKLFDIVQEVLPQA